MADFIDPIKMSREELIDYIEILRSDIATADERARAVIAATIAHFGGTPYGPLGIPRSIKHDGKFFPIPEPATSTSTSTSTSPAAPTSGTQPREIPVFTRIPDDGKPRAKL